MVASAVTAAQYIGIAIVAGYWVGLIFTRWMFIARPNRRFTLARIDDAQFFLEPDGGPSLLDEARAIATGTQLLQDPEWLQQRRGGLAVPEVLTHGRLRRRLERLSAPFIWNGSRDLVAWGLLHRVEADAAARHSGPELTAALMKAQSQLDDLPPRKRVYWSRVVHDLLEPATGAPPRDEATTQQILKSLLSELYNARDTKFTNLATQQNKVTWLVLVGLAILGALISQGYQDLVMAGAVGGILSRLQRELQRREVPSDYGLSWSVLFLSPVTGALSGWAGLLLLQALQRLDVINLKGLLPAGLDLTAPTGAVLGVAILFGISERLLDRLVRQAENEIAVTPRKPAQPAEGQAAEQPPLPAPRAAARV